MGLTRARRSFSARQQGRLARRRQEWSRAFFFCGARHAPHSNLTHARAFATHRCGVDGCARGRRSARAAEREGVCRRDDDGAGDGGSEAVDVHVWSWRASTAAASWARRPAVGEKRAGAERTGASERVPVSVSATTTGKVPLARAGHLGERFSLHRLASSSSVEASMSPSFSPPISPILCPTPGRSRADFLSGVRVALIGSRSARYFSPTRSPRARMSALMTCHLLWIPLRHLHRLPSSTAGFRSTFDRLPYGCLLFLFRLDLT